MNIIKLAFRMATAVQIFFGKARRFYYAVMLFGYYCPKCNSGLSMVAEGTCRCKTCGHEFDPTVAFQRCSACGAVPVLRVRRYQCEECGSDIRSKFLFDGLAYDAEYFKAKMAESRQRKKKQRERVRQMLAESRSNALPLQAFDLESAPGLLDALNRLTAGLEVGIAIQGRDEFDLRRYESHIEAHIHDFPVSLVDIPPLNRNGRKDLVWRFIALIFLAHTGVVDIWQDGQDIMVVKHEANTEGCGVFGEFEAADRIKGSLGGIEA